MDKTTYEPISPEDNSPATKADVAKILLAIEMLSEQIENK
jgi:hypothetical protein